MSNAKTKKVRIVLAALTRVEYMEVLEVPVNMTSEELDKLVDQRYSAVDGSAFTDDSEYWERSDSCRWESEDENASPGAKVLRNPNGTRFKIVHL